MAAITPTAVLRESAGSNTMHIATFSTVANGDTWASAIPGIVGAWMGSAHAVTFSGTTITFNCTKDGVAGMLYTLSKS